jgi:transcriptional regulator GlxA family with amidase domain
MMGLRESHRTRVAVFSSVNKPQRRPLPQFSTAKTGRVVAYIDANLDCALSLYDLANLVQLSSRQFFRTFLNTFGTTPHGYVMKERVARAKELISKGQPLVEIAAELGFASQSHFSGVFRKVTGVSPGRFRQCEADSGGNAARRCTFRVVKHDIGDGDTLKIAGL